jgi:hypothetical protein
MKRWLGMLTVAAALMMLSGCGVYHANISDWKTSGQSQEKMEQDLAECEHEAALWTVKSDPISCKKSMYKNVIRD